MSKSVVDKNASRALVTFIRSYTDLLEKHLSAVRQTMQETVDGVMAGIQQISDATEKKKKQANEVLVKTYTNPDDEARKTMDAAQDEVNRILDGAGLGADGGGKSAGEADELRNKLRRSSGIFSKHMEALETLDGELSGLLLSMMGMLSRDDVIKQRIEHVSEGLQALQMSLGYLLVDFESRCRPEDIERFARDLKTYLLKSYTTEEEKALHFDVFGEDRKAS